MRKYVSVDMDFWEDPARAELVLRGAVEKALTLGVPVIAVDEHHQLLDHIPDADVLLNFDKHSDVCDYVDLDYLENGTWITYVPWKSKGEYIWIRNSDIGSGNCQSLKVRVECGGNYFRSYLKWSWDYRTGWGKLRSVYRPEADIRRYINKGCVGLGISWSEHFAPREVHSVFFEIIEKYGLKYEKFDDGRFAVGGIR